MVCRLIVRVKDPETIFSYKHANNKSFSSEIFTVGITIHFFTGIADASPKIETLVRQPSGCCVHDSLRAKRQHICIVKQSIDESLTAPASSTVNV
jgi:hypothetical protein